ncbi:AAA family ATPase, partial [Candidatus Latescibacterota bacterium]
MKIAVSGKGGVGKTSLSALLCRSFHGAGYRVLAIDADPDANLASTLGFPDPDAIVPIVDMKDLIGERTGVQPGTSGGFFKLNPRVDDVPERFSMTHDGIRLLVMGRIKEAGTGCYCPESAFVKELIGH